MEITRRDFLKLAGASAAVMGLSMSDLSNLEDALANPGAPTVLWLQGAACTGCSVSFLNRVSGNAPKTAADVLIDTINLRYHPTLMAPAGDSAVDIVRSAYDAGGYILAVEGGVPTAFGGATCWAWTYNGVDVTFQQAVTDLAARAAQQRAIGQLVGGDPRHVRLHGEGEGHQGARQVALDDLGGRHIVAGHGPHQVDVGCEVVLGGHAQDNVYVRQVESHQDMIDRLRVKRGGDRAQVQRAHNDRRIVAQAAQRATPRLAQTLLRRGRDVVVKVGEADHGADCTLGSAKRRARALARSTTHKLPSGASAMPLGLLSEARSSPAPPQRISTSPRKFAASTW